MKIEDDVVGSVVNRLRRAEGQLGLEQCIAAGEDGKVDRAQLERLFLPLA